MLTCMRHLPWICFTIRSLTSFDLLRSWWVSMMPSFISHYSLRNVYYGEVSSAGLLFSAATLDRAFWRRWGDLRLVAVPWISAFWRQSRLSQWEQLIRFSTTGLSICFKAYQYITVVLIFVLKFWRRRRFELSFSFRCHTNQQLNTPKYRANTWIHQICSTSGKVSSSKMMNLTSRSRCRLIWTKKTREIPQEVMNWNDKTLLAKRIHEHIRLTSQRGGYKWIESVSGGGLCAATLNGRRLFALLWPIFRHFLSTTSPWLER